MPDLSVLVAALSGPTTSLDEAWAVAAALKDGALDLIRQGRQAEAIEMARTAAAAHPLDSWVLDMSADVLQWATWQAWNPFVVQQALALAERGRFAFAFRVEQFMKTRARNPFVMSAYMPKSGGTFISAALQRTYDYVTDIPCVFGTDSDVLLSPARVSVCAASGGLYNHTHLTPSLWNFGVLRDLRVPVWVHVRDPRDTFLSFLNMSRLEPTRRGPESDEFQARFGEQAGEASAASADALATKLFSLFEYQCTWAQGWLNFESPYKLLTRHEDLLRDECAFFDEAARVLGLPPRLMSFPPRDYQGARFFKGTNGRWRTALGASVGERLTEHMRTSGLLDVFPA